MAKIPESDLLKWGQAKKLAVVFLKCSTKNSKVREYIGGQYVHDFSDYIRTRNRLFHDSGLRSTAVTELITDVEASKGKGDSINAVLELLGKPKGQPRPLSPQALADIEKEKDILAKKAEEKSA